jgi:hypothetical protein
VRSFLAALCLSLCTSFAATADDPFTVSGVTIDATASNALEAQTAAMRQGQSDAARILIERLTLAEDRLETGLDFTPRMDETGEMVVEYSLADDIVAEMISGLEISDEQRSATRYLAQLDVSFDPRVVERVLAGYGVPFVASQSRPTLVLPVFEQAGQFILWDENPWRAAWEAQDFANALTPMYAPADPEARGLLSARAALSLHEDGLRQLGALYGVSRIAILRAQERDGLRRFGGYLVILPVNGEMQIETWGPETVFGGWSNAARSFVVSREDVWKQQSIVRDGEEQEMRVTVIYSGLPEWHSLRDVLTGASLVADARLDALSRDGALMTVNYRGDLGQLVNELAERGAALEDHPGVGWVVRTSY